MEMLEDGDVFKLTCLTTYYAKSASEDWPFLDPRWNLNRKYSKNTMFV